MEDNNEIKFGSDSYVKQTKDMENENDQPVSHIIAEVDKNAPKHGMVFNSYQEVCEFYKKYACVNGFETMQRGSKSEEGMLRYFTLACAKVGKSQSTAINSFKGRPSNEARSRRQRESETNEEEVIVKLMKVMVEMILG
ncbi:hypothetical protein LguiA_002048 [Lonicera macranthoides]